MQGRTQGRIPYRTALVVSAALGGAALGDYYGARTDDGARGDPRGDAAACEDEADPCDADEHAGYWHWPLTHG
jgi:hypothetical protein